MKVEIFSLCDFASADASGKLNIIGVFDTVWAKNVPAVHGLFTLVARIRFDRIEEGLKKIKISFVDADGNAIMPVIETQVSVQTGPFGTSPIAQVVSLMSQIRLPNFGEYSVDLAVDGRQEASTPLFLREAPTIPPHLQTQLPFGPVA